MPSTVLGDVHYLAGPFRDTLSGEFTDRLALYNGLLSNANGYIVPQSGTTQNIPKFNVVSGDSVPITTVLNTTVNNLADTQDIGVWVEREKAWGADDMVKICAGSDKDITTELARQVGFYWAGEIHKSAVNVMAGAYATTLLATHVKDDSGKAINLSGILDAKAKLGDNDDLLTSIIMNSKVKNDAIKEKLVTYDVAGTLGTYASGNTGNILGMTPFTTDLLAATAGVYPSYIGQKGSVVFLTRPRPRNQYTNSNVIQIAGPNGINIDVELARVSTTAGGQDVFISRMSYMVHVPYVSYVGAVNPSNATLATGASWTKVANDDKLIRLIQYLSA